MLKLFLLRKNDKEQERVSEKITEQRKELAENVARLKEIAARKKEASGK